MEQYLIDQFGVIEDAEWLTRPEDIVNYFKDSGRDYFDCGQGYYQEEASVICKIGDKFYEVTMTAEIESSWQDRGDRLYWVEDITGVTYKVIKKPAPKPEKIAISKAEYRSLQQDSAHLNELINRGVDNWQGYVGPYNYCEGCGDSVSWGAEKCPECGEEMDDGY